MVGWCVIPVVRANVGMGLQGYSQLVNNLFGQHGDPGISQLLGCGANPARENRLGARISALATHLQRTRVTGHCPLRLVALAEKEKQIMAD